MKRIGIVAKTDREEAKGVVAGLLEWCAARDCVPVLDTETAVLCPGAGVQTARKPDLPGQVDVLLVLGGDGTLLSFVHKAMGILPQEIHDGMPQGWEHGLKRIKQEIGRAHV